MLWNGLGNVKEKIKDFFKNVLLDKEINEFVILVYYFEEKLLLIKV